MNGKDSKNARQPKKVVTTVTKKSELKTLGNIIDNTDENNGDHGDHPLWRAASIQDKMNILLEVTDHSDTRKKNENSQS
tara:strand:+ start:100 stop:336 length:237 start_codon:yes stop_codon:yes gene_type:complete